MAAEMRSDHLGPLGRGDLDEITSWGRDVRLYRLSSVGAFDGKRKSLCGCGERRDRNPALLSRRTVWLV
ncbi:hypothetical protein ACW9HQ_38985, partial [Nocardia gipuzkoensis]